MNYQIFRVTHFGRIFEAEFSVDRATKVGDRLRVLMAGDPDARYAVHYGGEEQFVFQGSLHKK